MTFDQNTCTHLVDQDLEGALKALEGQVPLDPHEVAIIKYTPSVDNPHADYADEVYYPPEDNRPMQNLRDKILDSDAIDSNGTPHFPFPSPPNKTFVLQLSEWKTRTPSIKW